MIRVIGILVGLGACAIIALVVISKPWKQYSANGTDETLLSGDGETDAITDPMARAALGKTPAAPGETPQRLLQQQRQEQRSITEALARQVVDSAQAAMNEVTKVETALNKWSTDVEKLWTNENGKRLATVPNYLQAFPDTVEAVDVDATRQRASSIRLALDALKKPAETALSDASSLWQPTDGLLDQIATQHRQAANLLLPIATNLNKLESWIRTAPEAQANSPTLRDAVQTLQDDANRRLADRAAQAYRDELANQLAGTEELQREKARRESELEQQKLREQADALSDEKEQRQKLAKARSREVRRLMAPLFSKGSWQPVSGNQATEKPFSLKELEGYGCLNPTNEGVQRLALAMNNPSNKRPHPRFYEPLAPVDKWPAQQIKVVTQMRDLLIELGDALVELEMLAP